MDNHANQLEKKLHTLKSSWDNLSKDDGFSELFRIIHFPGYTTPAEWIFIQSLVDSMQEMTNSLIATKANFIKGNHAVIQVNEKVGH